MSFTSVLPSSSSSSSSPPPPPHLTPSSTTTSLAAYILQHDERKPPPPQQHHPQPQPHQQQPTTNNKHKQRKQSSHASSPLLTPLINAHINNNNNNITTNTTTTNNNNNNTTATSSASAASAITAAMTSSSSSSLTNMSSSLSQAQLATALLHDSPLTLSLNLPPLTSSSSSASSGPSSSHAKLHDLPPLTNDEKLMLYSSLPSLKQFDTIAPFSPSLRNAAETLVQQWLNERMKHNKWNEIIESIKNLAEDTSSSHTIVHRHRQSALKSFGIDSRSLLNAGIPFNMITRIYKALWVYSYGFHHMMSEISYHSSNSHRLLGTLWKVYMILLENYNPNTYVMSMMQLEKISQNHLKELEEHLQFSMNLKKEHEKKSLQEVKTLSILLERSQIETRDLLEKKEALLQQIQHLTTNVNDLDILLNNEKKQGWLNLNLLNKWKGKYESLSKDYERLQEQSNSTIHALKHDENELKQALTQELSISEQLSAKIDTITNEMYDKDSQIKNLQSNMNELHNEIELLKKVNDEQARELDSTQKTNHTLQLQLLELDESLTHVKQLYSDLQNEFSNHVCNNTSKHADDDNPTTKLTIQINSPTSNTSTLYSYNNNANQTLTPSSSLLFIQLKQEYKNLEEKYQSQSHLLIDKENDNKILMERYEVMRSRILKLQKRLKNAGQFRYKPSVNSPPSPTSQLQYITMKLKGLSRKRVAVDGDGQLVDKDSSSKNKPAASSDDDDDDDEEDEAWMLEPPLSTKHSHHQQQHARFGAPPSKVLSNNNNNSPSSSTTSPTTASSTSAVANTDAISSHEQTSLPGSNTSSPYIDARSLSNNAVNNISPTQLLHTHSPDHSPRTTSSPPFFSHPTVQQKEIEILKSDLEYKDKMATSLMMNVNKLKAQLQQHMENDAKKQQELNNLKNDVDKYKSDLKKEQMQKIHLQHRLQDKESAETSQQQIQVQLHDLKIEFDNLLKKKSTLTNEYNDLNEQLSAKAKQYTKVQKELKLLKTTHSQLTSDHNALQLENEGRIKNQQELSLRIRTLQNENITLLSRLNDFEAKSKHSTESSSLLSVLEQKSNEINRLFIRVREMEHAKNDMMKKHAQELSDLKLQLEQENTNKSNSQLLTETNRNKKLRQQLTEQSNEYQTMIDHLKKSIEQYKKSEKENDKAKVDMKQEIITHQNTIAELTKKYEDMKNITFILEQQISNLRFKHELESNNTSSTPSNIMSSATHRMHSQSMFDLPSPNAVNTNNDNNSSSNNVKRYSMGPLEKEHLLQQSKLKDEKNNELMTKFNEIKQEKEKQDKQLFAAKNRIAILQEKLEQYQNNPAAAGDRRRSRRSSSSSSSSSSSASEDDDNSNANSTHTSPSRSQSKLSQQPSPHDTLTVSSSTASLEPPPLTLAKQDSNKKLYTSPQKPRVFSSSSSSNPSTRRSTMQSSRRRTLRDDITSLDSSSPSTSRSPAASSISLRRGTHNQFNSLSPSSSNTNIATAYDVSQTSSHHITHHRSTSLASSTHSNTNTNTNTITSTSANISNTHSPSTNSSHLTPGSAHLSPALSNSTSPTPPESVPPAHLSRRETLNWRRDQLNIEEKRELDAQRVLQEQNALREKDAELEREKRRRERMKEKRVSLMSAAVTPWLAANALVLVPHAVSSSSSTTSTTSATHAATLLTPQLSASSSSTALVPTPPTGSPALSGIQSPRRSPALSASNSNSLLPTSSSSTHTPVTSTPLLSPHRSPSLSPSVSSQQLPALDVVAPPTIPVPVQTAQAILHQITATNNSTNNYNNPSIVSPSHSSSSTALSSPTSTGSALYSPRHFRNTSQHVVLAPAPILIDTNINTLMTNDSVKQKKEKEKEREREFLKDREAQQQKDKIAHVNTSLSNDVNSKKQRRKTKRASMVNNNYNVNSNAAPNAAAFNPAILQALSTLQHLKPQLNNKSK